MEIEQIYYPEVPKLNLIKTLLIDREQVHLFHVGRASLV